MRQKRFAHRTVEYYHKKYKKRMASRYPSPVVKKNEQVKEEQEMKAES